MSPDTKLVDFVTQLVRLTQEGRIRWGVASDRRPPPDAISAPFETEFDNRILRIYRRTVEEFDMGFSGGILVSPPRAPGWRKVVKPVLELISLDGQSLYQFPYVQGEDDLYQVASYQGSDAERIIEDVLSTKSPA